MRRILGVCLLLASTLHCVEESEPKKIVYFTLPKGGSQLFRKAIGLITERPLRKIFPLQDLSFLDTYMGYNHLEPGYEDILADPTGSFIKTVMIRDPRDVIISMVAWIQVMADTEKAKAFSNLPLEDQVTALITAPDLSMNGRYPYVFDTHLALQCALIWMTDPRVLVCRFEDLVGSKGGGTDTRQIEAIKTLAEHLHYNLPFERIEEIALDLFGESATFRVGQIGSWKSVFTAKHKELFKAKMGKELIELGYEKDDNW